MNLELDDQVVVVTGGANGIGLATSKAFLAENARVAIWDKNIDRIEDVASVQYAGLMEACHLSQSHRSHRERSDAVVAGRGPTITIGSEQASENSRESRFEPIQHFVGFAVDVTNDASLATALERTLAAFGRIDHWVHAAAIGSGKFGFPFTNLIPDDWDAVLKVNIMGMVRTAHVLAPILRQKSSGTITMIGSVAGQIGSQTDPPYSASKAAAINFTQCMAKDMAPFNVRANIVHPGMVKTDLNRSVWQSWFDRQPVEKQLSYDEWAEAKIRQLTPLGRWQTPDDVADLIVFLASKRANNITGQSINVDGGWVMRW